MQQKPKSTSVTQRPAFSLQHCSCRSEQSYSEGRGAGSSSLPGYLPVNEEGDGAVHRHARDTCECKRSAEELTLHRGGRSP